MAVKSLPFLPLSHIGGGNDALPNAADGEEPGTIDMYMCLCKDLTESGVQDVLHDLAKQGVSLDEALDEESLIDSLGLETDVCCGQCAREIDRFVEFAERVWPGEAISAAG